MFQQIIETQAGVQAFASREKFYLLSDRRIQVFEGGSYARVAEIELFEKGGAARSFIMDNKYIYCSDFIHLIILEAEPLKVITRLQLGADLSSDICGMAQDREHVDLCIRNGAIARIKKGAWEAVQFYPLSASSIWALEYAEGRLYAGNVEGQLLVIQVGKMEVEKQVQAHRQNLKSLCLFDQIIATAGQDKTLGLWERHSLEAIRTKKNAHKKAFSIIGAWKDQLLTVSFACGEIKVWEIATLREQAVIPIAACLTGQALLHQGYLYLSSRAIKGIERAEIDRIVGKENI